MDGMQDNVGQAAVDAVSAVFALTVGGLYDSAKEGALGTLNRTAKCFEESHPGIPGSRAYKERQRELREKRRQGKLRPGEDLMID